MIFQVVAYQKLLLLLLLFIFPSFNSTVFQIDEKHF